MYHELPARSPLYALVTEQERQEGRYPITVPLDDVPNEPLAYELFVTPEGAIRRRIEELRHEVSYGAKLSGGTVLSLASSHVAVFTLVEAVRLAPRPSYAARLSL